MDNLPICQGPYSLAQQHLEYTILERKGDHFTSSQKDLTLPPILGMLSRSLKTTVSILQDYVYGPQERAEHTLGQRAQPLEPIITAIGS